MEIPVLEKVTGEKNFLDNAIDFCKIIAGMWRKPGFLSL